MESEKKNEKRESNETSVARGNIGTREEEKNKENRRIMGGEGITKTKWKGNGRRKRGRKNY